MGVNEDGGLKVASHRARSLVMTHDRFWRCQVTQSEVVVETVETNIGTLKFGTGFASFVLRRER
jgi:hypothetical protein